MDKTTDMRLKAESGGGGGAGIKSISSDSGIGVELVVGDRPVARSHSMRSKVCVCLIIFVIYYLLRIA